MAKVGRPSKYTTELGEEICHEISKSIVSLKALCNKNPHWPHPDTIFDWVNKHEEFHLKYDQARRRQAEVNAERLHEFAEDLPTFIDKDGIERVDSGMLGKHKLLADIKKWQASKLAPKIYGDKQTVTVEDDSEKKKLIEEVKKLRAELDKKNEKEY